MNTYNIVSSIIYARHTNDYKKLAKAYHSGKRRSTERLEKTAMQSTALLTACLFGLGRFAKPFALLEANEKKKLAVASWLAINSITRRCQISVCGSSPTRSLSRRPLINGRPDVTALWQRVCRCGSTTLRFHRRRILKWRTGAILLSCFWLLVPPLYRPVALYWQKQHVSAAEDLVSCLRVELATISTRMRVFIYGWFGWPMRLL